MSASVETFRRYLNPVFIETGSYKGHGIQYALNAGFEEIYSIEILPEYFEMCSEKFKGNVNVNLILGNSAIVLEDLLRIINLRITFWLDGHLSGLPDVEPCPLLKELEIIGRHHIKNHTILIDDLRDWSIIGYGFNTEILKEKILLINGDYEFKFEDGHIPNDILVAYVDN